MQTDCWECSISPTVTGNPLKKYCLSETNCVPGPVYQFKCTEDHILVPGNVNLLLHM